MSKETKTIVVAWTVESRVFDGRPFAADLGARPGLKTIREGRACIWRNRGSEADVVKARAYAETENTKRGEGEGPILVFIYPTSEKEPLDRARREVSSKAAA